MGLHGEVDQPNAMFSDPTEIDCGPTPTVTPNTSSTTNKKNQYPLGEAPQNDRIGCFGEGRGGFGNFSSIKVGRVIPYSKGLSVPTKFC